MKTCAIRRYEPQSISARTIRAMGTISAGIGMGTSRFTPAAMAPMSAPALIVLATTSAATET